MEKVSVIMPCYNHAGFIGESIESILNQSYGDLELIIVDDRSIDDSVEIIKEYERADKRVVFRQNSENLGVSNTRNNAINTSSGEYIAFCDADDVWEKDKLETQIRILSKNPSYGAMHSDSIVIDEKGRPTGKRFSTLNHKGSKVSGYLFYALCLRNFINTQTVILKRDCLNGKTPFKEDFKYFEDWICWINIAKDHNFLYVDEPLAKYRVHEKSTRRDREGYIEHRIRVYDYILNRYPDIPLKIRSKIFYQIGINYSKLGERFKARDFFYKGFNAHRSNFRSLFRYLFTR